MSRIVTFCLTKMLPFPSGEPHLVPQEGPDQHFPTLVKLPFDLEICLSISIVSLIASRRRLAQGLEKASSETPRRRYINHSLKCRSSTSRKLPPQSYKGALASQLCPSSPFLPLYTTQATTTMPTNRSFFSHLFAAFRAQRPLKPSLPQTTTSTATSQSTSASSTANYSSARPISTTAALTHQRSQQPRALSTSPRSPSPTNIGAGSGSGSPKANAMVRRRGSDTSSSDGLAVGGGFREVRKEGWMIGGTTASGEERWLRLGVVRRSFEGQKSVDGLSL